MEERKKMVDKNTILIEKMLKVSNESDNYTALEVLRLINAFAMEKINNYYPDMRLEDALMDAFEMVEHFAANASPKAFEIVLTAVNPVQALFDHTDWADELVALWESN
jgi:hypothetical protein